MTGFYLRFVIETTLVLSAIAVMAAAILIDRAALRTGDYLRFEARAVRARRLTVASLALLLLYALLATPVAGVFLLGVAVLWVLWCLPASHRRLQLGAEAVFDAPPEAVASVMFDVSQQPRWMEGVLEAALVTPGMLRLGSVIRQTVRISGHLLTATLVVTDLVPYERLRLLLQVRYAEPYDLLEVFPHERGSLVRYSGGHVVTPVTAILTAWEMRWLRKRFNRNRAAGLERLRSLVASAPLARARA